MAISYKCKKYNLDMYKYKTINLNKDVINYNPVFIEFFFLDFLSIGIR